MSSMPCVATNHTCSTCQHWHGNSLSVSSVRLIAHCTELSDNTLADDYCSDWTPSPDAPQVIHKQPCETVEMKPAKQLKHYNCWDAQEWTCEECGITFTAKPSNKDGVSVPRRFCGDPCYRKWQQENPINEGCFKPGHVPANKGVKGIHLSPETEFKKGHVPPNTVPVGTLIIRQQRHGSARQQAFVKIGEPNAWKARALINWEAVNGPLPKGLLLWHIDGDSLNDDVGNLQAVTRAENLALMRARMDPEKRSQAMKEAWKRRRREQESLKHKSVKELKQLGYTHYCPLCELPSRGGRLTCRHKTAKALVL
jgi:hypothetical protein